MNLNLTNIIISDPSHDTKIINIKGSHGKISNHIKIKKIKIKTTHMTQWIFLTQEHLNNLTMYKKIEVSIKSLHQLDYMYKETITKILKYPWPPLHEMER